MMPVIRNYRDIHSTDKKYRDNVLFGTSSANNRQLGVTDEQITELLNKPNRPTAVFCSDIQEAEKFYILAMANNIKIPEDISIVTCCDNGERSYLSSKIARVEKHEFYLGYKAAQLLQSIKKKKSAYQ